MLARKHTHTHARTHACTHTHTHTNTQTHKHINTNTRTHIHTHVYKRGGMMDEQITKTYVHLVLGGKLRAVVRFVPEQDGGGGIS